MLNFDFAIDVQFLHCMATQENIDIDGLFVITYEHAQTNKM